MLELHHHRVPVAEQPCISAASACATKPPSNRRWDSTYADTAAAASRGNASSTSAANDPPSRRRRRKIAPRRRPSSPRERTALHSHHRVQQIVEDQKLRTRWSTPKGLTGSGAASPAGVRIEMLASADTASSPSNRAARGSPPPVSARSIAAVAKGDAGGVRAAALGASSAGLRGAGRPAAAGVGSTSSVPCSNPTRGVPPPTRGPSLRSPVVRAEREGIHGGR